MTETVQSAEPKTLTHPNLYRKSLPTPGLNHQHVRARKADFVLFTTFPPAVRPVPGIWQVFNTYLKNSEVFRLLH